MSPTHKEVQSNAFKEIKTPDENDHFISHAEIQDKVGLSERIQKEKELKEAYSDHNLNHPDIQAHYKEARKDLNTTDLNTATETHKKLIDANVNLELKEKVTTVLKTTKSHIKDENAHPISHAEIHERARTEVKNASTNQEIAE
jgi:galactitol-specific phosphotransferase system IIB component